MANAASDDDLFEDLRPGETDDGQTVDIASAGGEGGAAGADEFGLDHEDLAVGLDSQITASIEGTEDQTDGTSGDVTAAASESALAEGAEPPEDDSDLDGYSEKVRKRIMRERRLTRQAREDAAAARAEAQAAQEAVAKLQADVHGIAREKQAREITAKLEESKGRVAALREKYRQARIDGDVDAELKIQEELSEADFERRLIEAAVRQQQQAAAAGDTQAGANAPAPRQQPAAAPQIPETTKTWVERNAGWYGKDAVLTAAAQAIDKQMYAEGLRPTSAAYFAELDRRMVARGLRKPGGAERRAASPVASASGEPANGGRPSNRVQITEADKKLMRSFRLDPNNPQHVKQFAIEKRAANRSA